MWLVVGYASGLQVGNAIHRICVLKISAAVGGMECLGRGDIGGGKHQVEGSVVNQARDHEFPKEADLVGLEDRAWILLTQKVESWNLVRMWGVKEWQSLSASRSLLVVQLLSFHST
jgi:hypothetical protein